MSNFREKYLRDWLSERRDEYPSVLEYDLDFEQVLSVLVELTQHYKETIGNCVTLIDWEKFFEMHPEIAKECKRV